MTIFASMLKKKYLQLIENNTDLQIQICGVAGRSQYTIKRWIEKNQSEFLSLPLLEVIADYAKVKNINELIENKK